MSAINTSYKTSLSHWESCVIERLMGLIHEILLNQVDSPIELHCRLNDLDSTVQELAVEFNRDRDADNILWEDERE